MYEVLLRIPTRKFGKFRETVLGHWFEGDPCLNRHAPDGNFEIATFSSDYAADINWVLENLPAGSMHNGIPSVSKRRFFFRKPKASCINCGATPAKYLVGIDIFGTHGECFACRKCRNISDEDFLNAMKSYGFLKD